MRAAVAISQNFDDPLSGLQVQDYPDPVLEPGLSRVRVIASSLNMHDVWTLRGVGHPPERIPIVLGCDASGYDDDGNAVIVHPVFGDPLRGRGDVTLDPKRTLLGEHYNGGLAEYIVVPTTNLIPKPDWLSFEEAAALPVAWGTAYRMLFTHGEVHGGDRVLVQGAFGGVATAAIALARAAGATVYATSRTEEGRQHALAAGAHVALNSGERVPERVDVVIETVGEATWDHSLKSLRPGGAVVIAGATSGSAPSADLSRIFFQQLRVIGSTGVTLDELAAMLRLMQTSNTRPSIDRVLPLERVREGYQAMLDGNVAGKIIITVGEQD
jgi:NADPH:quinone reductase-like Zn-dependent oxidoreductase